MDPQRPIVAGFCTIIDLASPCTSGFEQVDLANRTTSMVFDLTTAREKGNGNVTAGHHGKFYAAVATYDLTAGFVSQIQEFDINTKTSKIFYPIADPNYAAYALGFDPIAQRLYVGEKKADGAGQVAILDGSAEGGAPAHMLNVPLPPAKVTFLP